MNKGTRLNKFLASCGVGSRRACDQMVQDGHVEINGQPCMNPAEHVVPDDFVKVDGKRVQPKATGTILLNKPKGLVCTKRDELQRDTIFALLPLSLQHLQHVGRLDRESEGLLIMTNDGDLSQSLAHPSRKLEKEYLVTSNQPITNEHLDLFLSGIFTEEGKMKAAEVERVSPRRYRIVLTTGYKRQIRVMFQKLGYHVQRLVRTRIGSLDLPAIPPGKWLRLGPEEIELLGKNPPTRKRPAPKRKQARKPSRKTTGARKSAPARKTARKSTGRSSRSGPPQAAAKAGRRTRLNAAKRRKN